MNDYLKEVTEWDDLGYKIPSHTYIVNKATQLVGYIKEGTTEEIIFKSPMKQFAKARRKFLKVSPL